MTVAGSISWRTLRAPLLLTLLVLGSLVVPLPVSNRLSASLHAIAHVGWGALLVVVFSRWLRRSRSARSELWIALVSLCAAGFLLGLGEILQPLAGRTASVRDLVTGAVGGLAGLAFVAAGSRKGVLRAALAAVALAILLWPVVRAGLVWYDHGRQRETFPLLASFADRLELSRWGANDADHALSDDHATHGDGSLLVTLYPSAYPGVSMAWPPRDWRGYEALAFDVWLDGEEPLDLILKVEDRPHDWDEAFRSLHPVRLVPGPNALCFPLRAIAEAPRGGPIDLGEVASFTLMAVDLETPRRFWLDAVRLEP